MYSALYQVTAPAQEPVSVDLARRHCRIDYKDDDDLLNGIIASARVMAETFLNRSLITQTLRYVAANQPPNGDGWPMLPISPAIVIMPQWFNWSLMGGRPINLPRAPTQSVTSVSVGHWGHDDRTLTVGRDYQVDVAMQPGRVRLLNMGVGLGGPTLQQDHIQIEYVAGYGDAPSAIPQPIITGILWLVAYLYENRGDVEALMPIAAERILTPYRIVTFGA